MKIKYGDALKSCPCCGGAATLRYEGAMFKIAYVLCEECGLRTKALSDHDKKYEIKLIDLWNRRL